eukprot:gene317-1142_t
MSAELIEKTKEIFGGRTVTPAPHALRTAWSILEKEHDFCSDKTLFVQSTCPDEVNRTFGKPVSAYPFMNDDVFHFGGLGGVSHSGRVGLGACCSHVPDGGKVMILFGPHIGITNEGDVAKVKRRGIKCPSTSCGAAVGACNILKGANWDLQHDSVVGVHNAGMNEQMEAVLEVCKKVHDDPVVQKEFSDIKDALANFTATLYHAIEQRLEKQLILNSKDLCPSVESPALKYPIAFLGGVQVNTDHIEGGPQQDDLFVPMQFELWTPPECKGGEVKRTSFDVDRLALAAGTGY